ncbi:MAG: hypothetical protein Q4C06_01515, partial [Bacillota bacterium]|nr:hypothetical protein [Bacillota bacterium]
MKDRRINRCVPVLGTAISSPKGWFVQQTSTGDTLFSSAEINSACGFYSGNASFPEPFRGKTVRRMNMKQSLFTIVSNEKLTDS